jgi:hypothetical protein
MNKLSNVHCIAARRKRKMNFKRSSDKTNVLELLVDLGGEKYKRFF